MSDLPDWVVKNIPHGDGVEEITIVELFNKETMALEFAARPGPRIIEHLRVGLPLSNRDYGVSWLRGPTADEYKVAVSTYRFPGRKGSVKQTLQALTNIYARDGKSRQVTMHETTGAYVVDLRDCSPLIW